MKCLSCMRGFTNECRGGGCNGTAAELPREDAASEQEEVENGDSDSTEEADEPSTANSKRVRRTKPDAALKDQQSTGRKRAARLYPLDRNAPCEWRGKSRQGGGDNPIQGCTDGMQLNRHHGPDKNTLNNDEGNVHRICAHCHNRWHAKNDPDYDPNKPLKD